MEENTKVEETNVVADHIQNKVMDQVTKLIPVETGYGYNRGADAACAIKESEADIRRDVASGSGETRRDVKESEGELRRDIAKTEADLVRDVLTVRSDLRDSLGLHRNNSDAQFLALSNRLCEQDKLIMDVKDEVVKQGYENRLASKDTLISIKDQTLYFADKLSEQTNRITDRAENYQAITTATLAQIKCCVCPVCPCPNGNGNGNN